MSFLSGVINSSSFCVASFIGLVGAKKIGVWLGSRLYQVEQITGKATHQTVIANLEAYKETEKNSFKDILKKITLIVTSLAIFYFSYSSVSSLRHLTLVSTISNFQKISTLFFGVFMGWGVICSLQNEAGFQ